jgi:radical SAM/Cys-rich protein
MAWQTMQSVLSLAEHFPGCRVDLTGGAPELNPHFRRFVEELRSRSHPVQVRTNLAVYSERDQLETPEFLARNQVHLVASLPCYLDENVDKQRGNGVYQRSVAVLKRLNVLGYGRREELPLNLVYNPGGAFLPPDQEVLENDYRQELHKRFGIEFSHLLAIANMPIGRFFRDLERQGEATNYETLLRESFNPETLPGLMCRHQVCVAWDGRLGDCDFNLALGLNMTGGLPSHIDQLSASDLQGRHILTGDHCFGCTAGSGSSCGGTLVA